MQRAPRRLGLGAGVVIAFVVTAIQAHAACNLIPSATQTFRGTLGSTNKPFAAPGDFVEIGVRPAVCDAASPGLAGLASDHIVSVIFTPSSGAQRRVVFLTSESCASPASLAKKSACEATAGVGEGNVTCVDSQSALALVMRNSIPHLSFRFPDTDRLFLSQTDDRTLSGPATIAVTRATAPLPCGLVRTPCSSAAGTRGVCRRPIRARR